MRMEDRLSEHLDIDKPSEIEDNTIAVIENPLKQNLMKSSFITDDDIENFKYINEELGIENFSKIMLMKITQKAMTDHDEIQKIIPTVDESKAARLMEVAANCLNVAADTSKNLLDQTNITKKMELDKRKLEMTESKLELERKKLEVKNLTVNNIEINNNDNTFNGTQKDILDKLKDIVIDDNAPPLIEN